MDEEQKQDLRKRMESDLQGMFDMVDKDHDGFIETEEMKKKMNDTNFMPLPPHMAKDMTKEEQVAKFFEMADIDSDGKVDIKELKIFFFKLLGIYDEEKDGPDKEALEKMKAAAEEEKKEEEDAEEE